MSTRSIYNNWHICCRPCQRETVVLASTCKHLFHRAEQSQSGTKLTCTKGHTIHYVKDNDKRSHYKTDQQCSHHLTKSTQLPSLSAPTTCNTSHYPHQHDTGWANIHIQIWHVGLVAFTLMSDMPSYIHTYVGQAMSLKSVADASQCNGWTTNRRNK
jgi:hypothetical protein